MNYKLLFLNMMIIISSQAMQSPSLIKIISDSSKTEDQIVAELNLYLPKGVDVNKASQDIPYFTPLMRASDLGYLKVVELLLDYAADINSVDNLGSTALFYAARKGHLPIVRLLLLNGANAKVVNKQGNTILLDTLRSYGANLDETRKPNSKLKPDAFRTNIYQIVELLIQRGAEINKQGSAAESSRTPVMWAAFFRDWALVKLLKSNNANLCLRDANKNTLQFYLPTSKNDPKVYKDLNVSDKKFVDALHKEIQEAIIACDWEII